MESVTTTTIRRMLSNNCIIVPSYQRAYSWDVRDANDAGKSPQQIDIFLSDLEEYIGNANTTPYYFGHFLFEDKKEDNYAVIDGQQRLTTIVIFMSALFKTLESRSEKLSDKESEYKGNIIKYGNNTYRFQTVEYDWDMFKDYVIEHNKLDVKPETTSANRIKKAYDHFMEFLKAKDTPYLKKMMNCVANAECTTHIVHSEVQAVQMFIFQNDRGKKPSLLEIIKADMMFAVHIVPQKTDNNITDIIAGIQNRFTKIYKSISEIEHGIHEDEVLLNALRVYDNSLNVERNEILPKIRKEFKKSASDTIKFAEGFSLYLEESFTNLSRFFNTDNNLENYEIASLIQLGNIGFALPFILKAYKYNVDIEGKKALASALESILLRNRLIGTRANLHSRLGKEYQEFQDKDSFQPVIDKINYLKQLDSANWWDAYWNNEKLAQSLQGEIYHPTAKFLLWKYENYLRKESGGHSFLPYNTVEQPELEHIAPQTPKKNEKIASGYCDYDEDFLKKYLNCLGNYLLLPKSHNDSIKNNSFVEKRKLYGVLAHHREVLEMTEKEPIWTKELIAERKEKIINFIMETF